MPSFDRYIGIDYSGAETPTASLKGLRVYLAGGGAPPAEVPPPPSPRKYWTRRGVAEWLVEWLTEDIPTLVGIDHGFSFPLRYFEAHRLELHSNAVTAATFTIDRRRADVGNPSTGRSSQMHQARAI